MLFPPCFASFSPLSSLFFIWILLILSSLDFLPFWLVFVMVFFLFVCCLLFILFLFRQQNQFTPRPTGGAPAAEQLRPCADPPCPDGYLTTLGVFHRLFESEFLGFFLFFSFVWSFSAVPGLSCQVQSKGANFPPRISPPFSLRFLCRSLILIFLWRFLSLRIFILVLGVFFNYYF